MNESDAKSQDAQSWKSLYRAAVLETNMELVPLRVLEARKAAGGRAMHLIREAAVDEPELQDLVYACRVLDELERKCQSARHSRPAVGIGMNSKLVDAIGLKTHAVALTWADAAPQGAIQLKPGRWGCVVSVFATVAAIAA